MFSSLRVKLSVAFALVILLAMLLSGSAFAFVVQKYDSTLAAERLAELAVPISMQVRLLERAGAPSGVISSFLQDQADEMGVRILLVDTSGRTVEDTQGSLRGQLVDLKTNARIVQKWGQVAVSGIMQTSGDGSFYYVAVNSVPIRQGGDFPPQAYVQRFSPYIVTVAVPQQTIGSAWLSIAPLLSVAAVLAIVVSVGTAMILARSIAKPVIEVTKASEEVAKGHYDHTVEVSGSDEVARLAKAFNEMAHQVGQTQKTLREFLANVSHELKTPLTSIQGFSQAMVDGAITEPDGYAEAAGIINSESERMRKLVEDLLLLSRMETGQVLMERQRLDLGELASTCVERFRWRAEQRSIEMDFSADRSIPPVVGDSRRLEQVLGNLLDNAVRYTPEGGHVTVVVDAVDAEMPRANGFTNDSASAHHGHTRPKQWDRIRVHNTGSWIPEDELPLVFERFYRSARNHDRGGDGTGLGLSIVREIVSAHGGWVVARSSKDTGTEFEVNLPADSAG